MKRVALYVRVSHEEQAKHGLSVDSQITALEQYAKDNEYKIVGIYNDAGISARKTYTKRPALMRMIRDCQDKKIDLILITKLDRFFRSVPDYYAVMSQIGDNVKWRAIWEDYETETSTGVFKVNIMLSVAQSEADRTSERIKSVMDYKRAKGEVCSGGVATGYKIVDKRWVKDEAVSEAIDAFFSTYLSTFSRKKAIDAAMAMGLHLTRYTASNMLYSDKYCGNAPYIAEAYITQEQHDLMLSKKRKVSNARKHDYIFSGLCRCGKCGSSMAGARTIHHNKNGTTHHSIRYECRRWGNDNNCTGTSIAQKNLEAYLLSAISDAMDSYNLTALDASKKTEQSAIIEKDKKRLKRLMDLYELGDLDFAEYVEKRALLLEEISALQADNTQTLRALPDNWREIYNSLDDEHKNVFWSRAFDYVVIPERCSKTAVIFF